MKKKQRTQRYDVRKDEGIKKFSNLVGRFCDEKGTKTLDNVISEVIDSLTGQTISDVTLIITVKFLMNLWNDGLSQDDRIPLLVNTVSCDKGLSSRSREIPNYRLVRIGDWYEVGMFKN